MKPVPFDYARPATLEDAVARLSDAGGDAKVLAGGQSLGPMLNLRLAQPSLLVDVTRISELHDVSCENDTLTVGACVTHAEIEDGCAPDATRGMLPAVAADIAYRAVRNRGTVGGSLVHADPSADWVTALIALGAAVTVAGPRGRRRISLDELIPSAFETRLQPDEILVSIHVPKLASDARWGYYKFCRKTGEFAEAMSAIVVDPSRDRACAVIGATDARPVVIAGVSELIAEPDTLDAVIADHGLAGDPYRAQLHRVALWRAIEQVRRP